MAKQKLKLVPLGGLGEIGKNMMVLEYDDDLIIIDVGLMFPEEEMLGVDLVIPDISYPVAKREKLRGIIITHGHEDHCGALPYILPHLNTDIYSTRLTQGLISVKLRERKLLASSKLHLVQAGDEVHLGKFRVEFFPVCHSFPDSLGVIIRTPVGTVVHSGDFKIDHTPVNGRATDFTQLVQAGREGVLLFLSDSTYAELPGYTHSERVVGETLDRIMAEAPGRVIVTTFASLVSRVQQVIEAATKHDRRVFIIGRSMSETVRMALGMGYLSDPAGILGRLDELRQLPHNRVVLLATGSQGEPTSALVRIANRDHRQVEIVCGDTVVISATPIPGNEALINRTIDNLFRQGAQVLYQKVVPVHVHGHASQEELKLLISLVKPKFFVPIHGEYRNLSFHAKLAESMGIPKSNIFVLENGDILELGPESAETVGKTEAGNVYVDGLGVGDISSIVLRDRKTLSQDGIVVVISTVDKQNGKLVGSPDIISRGFVDMRESEALIEKSRDILAKILNHSGGEHLTEWGFINTKIKNTLTQFYYAQTRRRPMVIPVTIEV